jgi:hypothetical protein
MELQKQKTQEVERELEKERKLAAARFAANSSIYTIDKSLPSSPIASIPSSPVSQGCTVFFTTIIIFRELCREK